MSHKKSLLHQSCSSSLPITSTVCQSAQQCYNTPVLQYCQVIKVCSCLLLLVSCPSISCSLPHSCSFKPLLLILFTALLLLIKLCSLFVSHSQSCCPMSLSTVLFSSCSYQLSNCLLIINSDNSFVISAICPLSSCSPISHLTVMSSTHHSLCHTVHQFWNCSMLISNAYSCLSKSIQHSRHQVCCK